MSHDHELVIAVQMHVGPHKRLSEAKREAESRLQAVEGIVEIKHLDAGCEGEGVNMPELTGFRFRVPAMGSGDISSRSADPDSTKGGGRMTQRGIEDLARFWEPVMRPIIDRLAKEILATSDPTSDDR